MNLHEYTQKLLGYTTQFKEVVFHPELVVEYDSDILLYHGEEFIKEIQELIKKSVGGTTKIVETYALENFAKCYDCYCSLLTTFWDLDKNIQENKYPSHLVSNVCENMGKIKDGVSFINDDVMANLYHLIIEYFPHDSKTETKILYVKNNYYLFKYANQSFLKDKNQGLPTKQNYPLMYDSNSMNPSSIMGLLTFISLKIPYESDILKYLKFIKFRYYDNIIETLDSILVVLKGKDGINLVLNENFRVNLISTIADYKQEIKEELEFTQYNLNLKKNSKAWIAQKGVAIANVIYTIHRSMKSPSGCWTSKEVEVLVSEIEIYLKSIDEPTIRKRQYEYLSEVLSGHLNNNLFEKLREWEADIKEKLETYKNSTLKLFEENQDRELYEVNMTAYRNYSKNLYNNFNVAKDELLYLSSRITIFKKEYDENNVNNKNDDKQQHKLFAYVFLVNPPPPKEYAEKHKLNYGSVKTYRSNYENRNTKEKSIKKIIELQDEIRLFLIENNYDDAVHVFNRQPYLSELNRN